MIAVLDASGGVTTVLGRPEGEPIVEILRGATKVITPHLYVAEVTNVFWKYQQFGSMSAEQCEDLCDAAIALCDEMVDMRDIARESLNMACLTRSPAYDLFYLCLARRNNAILLSTDRKLLGLARQHSIRAVG